MTPYDYDAQGGKMVKKHRGLMIVVLFVVMVCCYVTIISTVIRCYDEFTIYRNEFLSDAKQKVLDRYEPNANIDTVTVWRAEGIHGYTYGYRINAEDKHFLAPIEDQDIKASIDKYISLEDEDEAGSYRVLCWIAVPIAVLILVIVAIVGESSSA